MPFCPNCGSEVTGGDRFCPSCGGMIGGASAGAQVPVAPAPFRHGGEPSPIKPIVMAAAGPASAKTSPSRRRAPFLVGGGCLIALILMVGVILCGVLWFTDDAVEAGKGHLALIRDGRVEEAYQSTSPDFQKEVPLAGYREMVEARAVLREMRDIRIPERNIENGVATITARVKDAGGNGYNVPMRLRKEGEQWRVIAIDWNEVPVGSAAGGADAPAVPRADPVAPPAEPLPMADPSVGKVVIGTGRDDDGHLIWPGRTVAKTAERISADIQLINHPAGGRVRVWIERKDGGGRTEPIEAMVEGQGGGNLTFNLKLGDEGIEPGDYLLVVLLGEDGRFETPFKVK